MLYYTLQVSYKSKLYDYDYDINDGDDIRMED